MVSRAFSALNRNPGLALAPILMDLTSFLLGLMTIGFWGESQLSLKLALDVGMPSISTILEKNVLASGVNFDLFGGGIEGSILLALLLLLLSAFVEAGFIGLLYELARDNAPSMPAFASYAKRFWLRILGLRLLVFVFTIVGGLLAMLLSIFGVLAFLVIFLILRVNDIYWEYTMVSEDIGIAEAFHLSRMYFVNRPEELSGIIIDIFLVNFIAALVVNLLWNPVVIFITIPFYCYVSTALQLALMKSKLDLGDLPLPVV